MKLGLAPATNTRFMFAKKDWVIEKIKLNFDMK